MYTTRYSLMERVRDRGDEIAWQEFYDLYQPLIHRYARQRGLNHSDSEEIVGQCFARLARAMPGFQYRPGRGKFKSWLKRLVNRRISSLLASRREGSLGDTDLPASTGESLARLWEQAWHHEVLTHCINLIRAEVSTRDYQVFQLNVLEEWKAERVAEYLQMSPEQVYRAKYRVLQIMREKMSCYLEE